MREYDGMERNYKISDPDQAENLERIKNILGFLPDSESLKFDLSFYSGGIGVSDKLAICCEVNSEQWNTVKEKLKLFSSQSALLIGNWAEDFVWLLEANGGEENINQFASEFINTNKSEFQSQCTPGSEIYFSYESDVNHWVAVWGSETTLNYLYFDQG